MRALARAAAMHTGAVSGECRAAFDSKLFSTWTTRFASRLSETGRPVPASNTATPTGEVSTRASRSGRTRRSAR